jgi:hypothetical protein
VAPLFSLRNFISLSGPYDLPTQSTLFAEHGFHSVLFSLVMRGDLAAYSPVHWLKKNLLPREEASEGDDHYFLGPQEQEDIQKELVLERKWRENYLPDEEARMSSPLSSPFRQVQREQEPKVLLIHGTKDNCVSWKHAHNFSMLLDQAGIFIQF